MTVPASCDMYYIHPIGQRVPVAPASERVFFCSPDRIIMDRVYAFVDGFNLYHSLVDYIGSHPSYTKVKWLDLHALTSRFIKPDREHLVKVIYFSAEYPLASRSKCQRSV